MSNPDLTPGNDAPDFPDNDRSFLEDQAPVAIDDALVASHTDAEAGEDEPGSDADAARD